MESRGTIRISGTPVRDRPAEASRGAGSDPELSGAQTYVVPALGRRHWDC